MTKLPSYLKGLVESRARSAGDIERLEQLRTLLDEELAVARKRQDAADILIRDFSPLLDPTAIRSVRAHKGRYGSHGSLKATIREVVQAAAPASLPSMEVAFQVAMRLALQFESVAVHRRWARNSIHAGLKQLSIAGEIACLRGETRGHETRWQALTTTAVVGLTGLAALRT